MGKPDPQEQKEQNHLKRFIYIFLGTTIFFAIALCILFFLHFGRPKPQGQGLTMNDLITSLSPNIIASLLSFSAGLLFYRALLVYERKHEQQAIAGEVVDNLRKADELKQVKQALDNTRNAFQNALGKWPQLSPTDVCKSSYECIPEVRKIKNQIETLDSKSATEVCYSFLKDFTTRRLEHLGKHLDIPGCTWVLVKHDDNKVVNKDLDLMTEADLAYDIISESIFPTPDKATGLIKAKGSIKSIDHTSIHSLVAHTRWA